MAIIYINKMQYDVSLSHNLLQTCLALKIDIPYFCWHPDLGSVGVCRLCAVKHHNNIHDVSGRIVMSCMTPISNNMIITTDDTEVKKFRKGIIELLMINHPHDCPICEEGGHCHLQDMTVLTNHNVRRYTFPKRIHRNQYLGEFITHQMNRCIGCYRCVRYYKDYAGGTDFGVYGISNNIYFGRFEDGSLESEHSGNLIEVCPTGVFTDKLSSKYYNRKWDLQYGPSICQNCSIGCNISIGEKYGILSKIENRYHKHINRYFLCDLGRFGHGYTNLKNRLKYPIKFEHDKYISLNKNYAITLISDILQNARGIIGIGSMRASLESNFALRKLVGKDNFSSGMIENDHQCVQLIIDILKNSGIYVPTLLEVEDYDIVLIIGEDITQTAPRLSLAIRQLSKKNQIDNNVKNNIPEWHSAAILNITNKNKCVYIVHTHETKLDDISELKYYASIKNQELFLDILCKKINNVAYTYKNISSNIIEYITCIYHALMLCKKPLIISGLHSGSINLIKLATNIAKSLQYLKKDVGLILLTSGANSIGVGLLSNMSITSALKNVCDDKIDTLVVLENDLYRYSTQEYIDSIIKKLKNIIVFDHLTTTTTQKSTVLFPTTSFIESSGTVINYESRAQRFFSAFDPKFYDDKTCVYQAWEWIYEIYYNINQKDHVNTTLDDVIEHYIRDIPIFKVIQHVAPNAKYRILGKKIARSPHRISSRTAIFSEFNIHEPGQNNDINTMFSFSMEGIQQPNQDVEYVPFVWSPGWNSIQAWNKYIFDKNNYNSGMRIFQTNGVKKEYFFNKINITYDQDCDWKIIPYYVLFGSEELSQNSDIIRNKCSVLYALVNEKYRNKFCLKQDCMIEFECLDQIFQLLIKFSSKIPLKTLGLPLGFPNMSRILLGCTVKNIRGVT
ncbi:NADH-quinone oxidoreductase subunit G [Buchnera aphidicola (Takecallis arundicolens)]|uniref:NADH-quinone oxidoreductase subunit NuoG n=1 Tax=Buchnera aphidicola TaxID=9 RepID=UPI0034642628